MKIRNLIGASVLAASISYAPNASAFGESIYGFTIPLDSSVRLSFYMDKKGEKCEIKIDDMFENYKLNLINDKCDETVDRVTGTDGNFKRSRKYRTLFKNADGKYSRLMEKHNLKEKWDEKFKGKI